MKNIFDFDDVMSGSADSAAGYAEHYARARRQEYLDLRAEGERLGLELLEGTGGLLELTPEWLVAHRGCCALLRACCCPPLSIDRLASLSRVRVGRIRDFEQGLDPVQPASARRRDQRELPAILEAIEGNLDDSIIPWRAEGRAPEPREASDFLLVVAERYAAGVPSGRKALSRALMVEEVDAFLREEGFAPDDCGTLSALGPGWYWSRERAGIAGQGGEDFVVRLQGGEVVSLFLRASGDYVSANKRRDEPEPGLRSLETAVLVLWGLFDRSYVRHQLRRGWGVVWKHDLEPLGDLLSPKPEANFLHPWRGGSPAGVADAVLGAPGR